MAVNAPNSAGKSLIGAERPRISPPVPARSGVNDFIDAARRCGIDLMPWQKYAGRFLYAGSGTWTFPDVAVVVARQNGKTELLLPLIVHRLKMGRRIVHAAQTRELPRLLFQRRLAPEVEAQFGDDAVIRKGAGQETIEIKNGGSYKIVAGTGGAPRGLSVDDILLDEVRELGQDFVNAILPTSIASRNPQTIYLSNAGSDDSTVLNSIRARAEGGDPSLAYLEWSAAPDRAVDDVAGWAEANPALGHVLTEAAIRRVFTSHQLAGTLPSFETENLCRWVPTLEQRLVDDRDWQKAAGETGNPIRPSFGISVDPDGERATIARAWRMADGRIALDVLEDVRGTIDTDAAGGKLRDLVAKNGRAVVGYDPDGLDAELLKYVKKDRTKVITGNQYAAASAQFALLVSSGRLVHRNSASIGADLTWTVTKQDRDGSFQAVRQNENHSISACLASIRAVWLASGPAVPTARVL